MGIELEINLAPHEKNVKKMKEEKKTQAESKYLVQAGLQFSTGPSRLSMLVRGSGVAVCGFLVGDRGRPLTRVT